MGSDSNLIIHAKREFEVLGWDKGDSLQKAACEAVLQLLEVLSSQRHSGMSAIYVVRLFNELARYKNLSPLTGEDYEWVEVAENLWQNNRCSHVFKTIVDGVVTAYDNDGIIFEEPNGQRYTSRDSRVKITFPYTPQSVIKMAATTAEGDTCETA